MNRLSTVLLFLLLGIQFSFAQSPTANQSKKIRPYIAYEFGEAAFNKFQSLSGEIGIRFPNDQMLRLTHMNVQFTEGHLSSDFAVVVKGEDVEGSFFGFEAFYDLPVFWKGFYISPSLGYYRNDYNHLILEESLTKKSFTLGAAISYREINIFGVKGLYYTLSLPLRTHTNPIKRTSLGDTIILGNRLDSNIWFFVGYEF